MTTAHATPEAMLALVQRTGLEAQRLEVLDHVMSCAECRQSFELLRSIEVAGRRAEHNQPRHLLSLALAASLVLLIGVSVVQRAGILNGPEVMRGNGAVTLLAPPEQVDPGQALVFAWRPVPAAQRYELEVLDAGDAVVFTTTTTDTTFAASALRLTPETEYRWLVRAVTPGGVLSSGARVLRPR